MKDTQLKDYKQAVWEYMMEHCEITKSGAYFIKFHTNNKRQFEDHVTARLSGYHREDPIEKEVTGIAKQIKHKTDKVAKKKTYKEEKKKRIQALRLVGRINNSPKWFKPILEFYGKNILKVW